MKKAEIENVFNVLNELPLSIIIVLAYDALWYGLEEHNEFAAVALRETVEQVLRPIVSPDRLQASS